MTTVSLLKPSFYHDSVTLLHLARDLRAQPGVGEVAVLMGTPANKQLLSEARLLTADGEKAGPNDLVIAVRAEAPDVAATVLARAETFFTTSRRRLEAAVRVLPRTLDSALRHKPDANLALISVPGAYAAAEARHALRRGLSVMLFSDNVSVEDEIALKRQALAAGLLLMGPDCGTAFLDGVPLGFANAVPRGAIGIVAASGSGLQQVTTLLAALGEGVSQAIGVGGRDGSAAVAGLMTLAGVDALAADPATAVVIVIGKPPAPEVRTRIESRVDRLGKPCVLAELGHDVHSRREGDIITVATLEDAAHAAAALSRQRDWQPIEFTAQREDIDRRARQARARMGPRRRDLLGLYAGGTLAHEAQIILRPLARARIVDLGADEYTVGRPHPMIDPTLRIEKILEAADAPELGVLLVDVVLGYGAAADPAADLAPALEVVATRAAVVASVVGTDDDLQGLRAQRERLEAACVWVLPSNAQAARAAALIVADGRPTGEHAGPEGIVGLRPDPPGRSADAVLPRRGLESDAAASADVMSAHVRDPSGPRRHPLGTTADPTPAHASGGRDAAVRDAAERPADLLEAFRAGVRVINIGLESFALDLHERGVTVVHLAWSPPAGGDPRLARLLARLEDE